MTDRKSARTPGKPVRGSATGRPVMVLLDVLGQRWTLRILWELRDGPQNFRELQARCDGVSPTMLNARLKELRSLGLIVHGDGGYRYTEDGAELGEKLIGLTEWADVWAKRLDAARTR